MELHGKLTDNGHGSMVSWADLGPCRPGLQRRSAHICKSAQAFNHAFANLAHLAYGPDGCHHSNSLIILQLQLSAILYCINLIGIIKARPMLRSMHTHTRHWAINIV